MGKMIGKALKMATGLKAIKKLADEKKLPAQKIAEKAKDKQLPVQKMAAQTKDNVEDITDQAKKNKKKLTSLAATTGAGSTLLG
tara:strand:+ start:140 stop:391 length:252 start_codon:yes stop_codon:yes gene_type:complete